MVETRRDLTGRTVVARASSLDPLGYVVRSGVGPGGGWGHWILDRTGDPGTVQGLSQFSADWQVQLAVVGDTVCPRFPHVCPDCERAHLCGCPRAHVPAEVLAWLPKVEGDPT